MANVRSLGTWRDQHKSEHEPMHEHGCYYKEQIDELQEIFRMMDGESRVGIGALYLYTTAQLSGYRIPGLDRLSIATTRQKHGASQLSRPAKTRLFLTSNDRIETKTRWSVYNTIADKDRVDITT
jgi:hypothetical protein